MEQAHPVFYAGICALTVAVLAGISNAQPKPDRPPSVANELIIVLDSRPDILFVGPAASAAPQIVARINADEAPGGGLDVGNPARARLVVNQRTRGRMAEWLKHNPDTPAGRLQRSIVLTYPETADIDAIERDLERNSHVERVDRNVLLQTHLVPSDPHVGTGVEDPEDAQWGFHALNLPAAWDRTTASNCYIGIVDEGLETQHPDLRVDVSLNELGVRVYKGGGFRAHLSRDVLNETTCSVDELDPDDGSFDSSPGHGTVVTGVAAATTNNEIGVASASFGCSFLSAKVLPISGGFEVELAEAAEGLDFLARRGAPTINMSFGANRLVFAGVWECDNPDSDVVLLCNAMAVAEERDVVMVAASGNHRIIGSSNPDVDFPALDPRTIAVGGLELGDPQLEPQLWVNESCADPPIQCGSWIGPNQDLMAPAQDILTTVYTGHDHEVDFRCGDSLFMADDDGYGLCTGTSVAAPFVTGLSGMTRRMNPALPKEDVRDVLTSTASIPGTKDTELGHGTPDAAAAIDRALGTVSGVPLTNRLVPAFAFYSPPPSGVFQAQTHVLTTVPQFGSAFLLEDVRTFNTTGPTISAYGAFPRFCTNQALPDCCPIGQTCCVGQGSECVPKILVDVNTQPRASIFIFTNDAPPTPSSPPLVPFYRLRHESAYSESCPSPPVDPISPIRDFAYATSAEEVATYLDGASLNGTFKYVLDGIEGYVYEHCDFGCPPEAVALHRLYNSSRHDTVIVLESEVAEMMNQGYLPSPDPDLKEIVGYALPNVDSDEDGLIDGFERLIGTLLLDTDSDADGISDGQELLFYDRSSPDPALRGYGDPCSSPCPIFIDGFESGNTTAWSNTVSG